MNRSAVTPTKVHEKNKKNSLKTIDKSVTIWYIIYREYS